MNKLLLTILSLFFTITILAQGPTGERIKAQKVAFITSQLDLSAKESQQFWPIYNTYEERIEQLRKSELKDIIQKMRNGGDANTLLERYITYENNMHQAKLKLINDLKPVIPARKILKLRASEEAFNKKLLDVIKNRRERIQNRWKNRN